MGFRLLRYASEGGPRAGILVDDLVYDFDGRLDASTGNRVCTLSLLHEWDAVEPQLRRIAERP